MEKIELTLNGQSVSFEAHSMERLLDIVRSQGYTGTKEGCGEGECGACSVFVEGTLVNSCLIPVSQTHGLKIETIEGIQERESYKRVKEAFLKCGGAQCGICTPGMVMAAVALLEKNHNPKLQEVREALAGNLCRCTGFTKIFESVLVASGASLQTGPL